MNFLLHRIKKIVLLHRRDGRVVDCGGLENRWGVTAPGGSNPSLSATQTKKTATQVAFFMEQPAWESSLSHAGWNIK